MNNEIGRKLTSLTLMTIMVAGGVTFAIPGVMPVAHAANANLFVSAENSQFSNYFNGPQVVEIVVIDPDISDTDQGKGEPDVTMNGNKVRMVQAVDGNWYGYYADRNQAQLADQTVEDAGVSGVGLDFGTFCQRGTDILSEVPGNPTVTVTQTVGIAVQQVIADGVQGTEDIESADCEAADVLPTPFADIQNVIREQKDINTNVPATGTPAPGTNGQIGVEVNMWPFIQLYNLNPTGNSIVKYNKGGGTQTTTLTFDTVDQFADLELDRTQYPQASQVQLTMTDVQLNIDPTDEDSWTWATNQSDTTGTFYQVFNENGEEVGTESSLNPVFPATGFNPANPFNQETPDIQPVQPLLLFEDNGFFFLDVDAQGTDDVVNLFDNNDQNLTEGQTAADAFTSHSGLQQNTTPVTFVELAPNTGILSNYDENDESNIRVVEDAKRGTSATVDYNDTPTTVLVGFGFGTIDIQPIDDEWNSGEEIPVILVDTDANKNSRVDEDLDLFDPQVQLIPALQTGDPFTLGESGVGPAEDGTNINATFVDFGAGSLTQVPTGNRGNYTVPAPSAIVPMQGTTVQAFSDRAILPVSSLTQVLRDTAVEALAIDLETDVADLRETINDPFDVEQPDNLGFHGLNLLNFDIRSINASSIDSTGIFLLYDTDTTNVDIINDTTGNLDAAGTTLHAISLSNVTSLQQLVSLNSTSREVVDPANLTNNLLDVIPEDSAIGFLYCFNDNTCDGLADLFISGARDRPIVTDFFSFGTVKSGVLSSERISNQIIRIEAEETGDNTSTFEGSLEYVMLNQLNILDERTYTGLAPIDDGPTFIVIEDLTDEDSPRTNYFDLGADGVSTQIADQQEAPTHSGVVSFDSSNYKIADTVTITLQDVDLNVDSDLVDIFTAVDPAAFPDDPARDTIGKENLLVLSFGALGRLADITFDDTRWTTPIRTDGTDGDCLAPLSASTSDTGLEATGFTLVETDIATGVFVGDFQIPPQWCQTADGNPQTTTGKDIEVNYVDFRDASGEIIEVGDSAGVRANTGSVSLDRTVYPVPFGVPDDYSTNDSEVPVLQSGQQRSVFPTHQTGMNQEDVIGPGGQTLPRSDGLDAGEFLATGDLQVHIRVNDPDFDISASGEDVIAQDRADQPGVGPIKIQVIRGAERVILGYGGGSTTNNGVIDVGADSDDPATEVRQFGGIIEIAPDAGIFELDVPIRYTDGPDSSQCPDTDNYAALNGTSGKVADPLARFDRDPASGEDYCILQGDILQVEYLDPEDASGDPTTVTDSATFDLRNGVLQSDKSVYIIGSDMIMTLIEPDFDLDNDSAETYDLDLIEWDSDAATVTMGQNNGQSVAEAFDPEPSDLRETGDSTGIFQIVVEIPAELLGDRLERGEEAVLEYTDWGPSGADFVGDEDEDVNLTIFTSNFGATVELDQKVFTWTDKVYITIVAPDHNFDSDLIDEIGTTNDDPVTVSTRGANLKNYKLSETGTDTGIFTGEVILTGFQHDADGNPETGEPLTGSDTNPRTEGNGPTDGFLQSSDDDGLSVSFEFSEDETVIGSSLIRWNIGENQWLEASYPASGTGVVRVVDPDMNLDPEAIDNFRVDVWSDSDAGGIDLTVTETNEATGIFEGTVFFTTTDESSGHRLRVAEGDTITAEYEDNTLPDPYTRSDELDILATSLIGTIVPPLERAPAANARVVDAFGNALATVSVDQQVQITADLANGQLREQSFAYLVQVQDANGVTVSLAWITGSLSAGQSFSPALSWTPDAPGTYTATVFVWESVDNPTALSPPVSVNISVS